MSEKRIEARMRVTGGERRTFMFAPNKRWWRVTPPGAFSPPVAEFQSWSAAVEYAMLLGIAESARRAEQRSGEQR